jgi:hypothetical protein
VDGCQQRILKSRNFGPRGRENRGGLLHIQITGQPMLETVLREDQIIFLRPDIFMGNGQLALIAARFNIIARDFTQQRHKRVARPNTEAAKSALAASVARRVPPNTSISQEASKPA